MQCQLLTDMENRDKERAKRNEERDRERMERQQELDRDREERRENRKEMMDLMVAAVSGISQGITSAFMSRKKRSRRSRRGATDSKDDSNSD